nr:unnamed protein product [Callosobruchus chinensis]
MGCRNLESGKKARGEFFRDTFRKSFYTRMLVSEIVLQCNIYLKIFNTHSSNCSPFC